MSRGHGSCDAREGWWGWCVSLSAPAVRLETRTSCPAPPAAEEENVGARSDCGNASGWAVASGGTERNAGDFCFGFALPYSSEAAPRRLRLSLSGPAASHLPRFLYVHCTFVRTAAGLPHPTPNVIKDEPGPGSCVPVRLVGDFPHLGPASA